MISTTSIWYVFDDLGQWKEGEVKIAKTKIDWIREKIALTSTTEESEEARTLIDINLTFYFNNITN